MSDNSLFTQKKSQYLAFRSDFGFSDCYPKMFDIAQLREKPVEPPHQEWATAGRVLAIRTMGKLIFLRLYDASGQIQLSVEKKVIGDGGFEFFKKFVAIGDHLGASGELYHTQKGELTLRVKTFKVLNKNLRSLPEKYHGIQDLEFAYRHRYLDVIFDEKSRLIVKNRVKFIREMRNFLDEKGFFEFETPILQTEVSGAAARPFLTHHQSLDLDCNLRIACETYLKRCVIAGFDRVYEFARTFRNEGLSTQHLQEFTMLEFYIAYFNYNQLREFVEDFLKTTVFNTFGKLTFEINGEKIDFSQPIPVVSYSDLFKEKLSLDFSICSDQESVLNFLEKNEYSIENASFFNYGALVDQIFKKYIRPELKGPIFVKNYPVAQLPLARPSEEQPFFADVFQLVIVGQEIIKLYSELVDPIKQREYLTEQARLKQAGDEEAMSLDEDFIRALEYGLPPTAGLGLGVDRLLALLMDCSSIRDAVFFPLMKPRSDV
jgi:lysyl-tRNA synthetase class 2